MADATISSAVKAAVTNGTSSSSSSSSTSTTTKTSLADNFSSFLTLLTTQLKNQNPLEPLDTNQFTQQLVQFSQVEQQLKMNDQMATLIKVNEAGQAAIATSFLGAKVTVEGDTTQLADGKATWVYNSPKPASATINIVDTKTGQTVYTANQTLATGNQTFSWNGRDTSGRTWADGTYKMLISAKDASGQAVTVSTQVEGTVDGVDLSQNPPVLSVGGQNVALDKIKKVSRT